MFSEIVAIKIPNFQGQIARARVNDFVRRETFTRSTEMYHRVNTISLRKYLKKSATVNYREILKHTFETL